MRRLRETSLPQQITSDIKAGAVLAGDDFSLEQCEIWFAQEKDAFYQDDAGNSDIDNWYGYMRFVNERLGFSIVEGWFGQIGNLLAIGPGSGIEVEQFSRRHPDWSLNFVEASKEFQEKLRRKWPHSIVVEPTPSGDLAIPADSQQIICALSVLHHIPNVSHVLRELYRVAAPGAALLVREPCSSMGDWRFPRSATPNERGLSRVLLERIAARAGFVEYRRPIPIVFEPINRLLKRTIGNARVPPTFLFTVDRTISMVLSKNDHYWRDTRFKKMGPSSYFYVFQKPSNG